MTLNSNGNNSHDNNSNNSSNDNNSNDTKKIGGLMMGGVWLMLMFLGVLFFMEVEKKRVNPNQNLTELLDDKGRASVILERNAYGHYVATGKINGKAVDFLVDTGASGVAMSKEIADRLGLSSKRRYTTETAGGYVDSYALILDTVSLGPIVRKGVRGSIVPDMPSDEVLLGMTFLRDLELIQKQGVLIIRQ